MNTTIIEFPVGYSGQMAGKRVSGTLSWKGMMIFPEIKIVLTYLSLLVSLSCTGQEVAVEEFQEREFLLYVCHNPNSIWHLSECNDQCTARDYDSDAYCHALFAVQCERPAAEFVRIACGLYYRQRTTQR